VIFSAPASPGRKTPDFRLEVSGASDYVQSMKRCLPAIRSASSVSLLVLLGLILWRAGSDENVSADPRVSVAAGSRDPVAAFEKWLGNASNRSLSKEEEREWVVMARQRATLLVELARTRPAVARARLMSLEQLAGLPEAVRGECEQPWSAVGDFMLRWETTEGPDGSIECHHRHLVRAGGEVLEAFGPHLREARNPRTAEFLQGHGIGDILLLDDAPNPSSRLADGGGTGGGGTAEAPTMDNHINALFIRVDFSDFPGEVNSVSKAALEATLVTVATRINQYSYGAASLTSTVSTTLYRMPATGASYATTGNNDSIRHIARLNADCSVDPNFLTGLGFNAPVTDILRQPDGKLVVAGLFTSYDGTACNRLIRLNPNGTADTAFVSAYGAGPDAAVKALAIETSGKLLVSGEFSNFAGQPARKIVRLLTTGARDTLSPVNVDPVVSTIYWIDSVAALADGKIVIGGQLWQNYDGAVNGYRAGLVRLHANGNRDTSFDVGAGSTFNDRSTLTPVATFTIQPDGKLLVGG